MSGADYPDPPAWASDGVMSGARAPRPPTSASDGVLLWTAARVCRDVAKGTTWGSAEKRLLHVGHWCTDDNCGMPPRGHFVADGEDPHSPAPPRTLDVTELARLDNHQLEQMADRFESAGIRVATSGAHGSDIQELRAARAIVEREQTP